MTLRKERANLLQNFMPRDVFVLKIRWKIGRKVLGVSRNPRQKWNKTADFVWLLHACHNKDCCEIRVLLKILLLLYFNFKTLVQFNPWFKFYFPLLQTHYESFHTPRKIKLKPRIKLNHNTYSTLYFRLELIYQMSVSVAFYCVAHCMQWEGIHRNSSMDFVFTPISFGGFNSVSQMDSGPVLPLIGQFHINWFSRNLSYSIATLSGLGI